MCGSRASVGKDAKDGIPDPIMTGVIGGKIIPFRPLVEGDFTGVVVAASVPRQFHFDGLLERRCCDGPQSRRPEGHVCRPYRIGLVDLYSGIGHLLQPLVDPVGDGVIAFDVIGVIECIFCPLPDFLEAVERRATGGIPVGFAGSISGIGIVILGLIGIGRSTRCVIILGIERVRGNGYGCDGYRRSGCSGRRPLKNNLVVGDVINRRIKGVIVNKCPTGCDRK